jgi:hypothetical protein
MKGHDGERRANREHQEPEYALIQRADAEASDDDIYL